CRGRWRMSPSRSTPCTMVRTTFFGPTDFRGSRIRAHSVGAGNRPGFRIVLSWDHATGSCENHEAAAVALSSRLHPNGKPGGCRILCSNDDGAGYVFAFVPEGEA